MGSHDVGDLRGEALRERVGEQRRAVGVEQQGHALLTEQPAVVLPFVVLVLHDGGGQAEQAGGVGKLM